MEPMMVHAILAPQFESADESSYRRVVDRVRDYIDKSTGIQTLAQMQWLAQTVAEFGFVPAHAILDAPGYKRIYNDALMSCVRDRVCKLERGELAVEDFTVKHAVALLRALHAGGVRLYLASGTDQDDVRSEAAALGYADCFEGRIYGASSDVTREAKREVLDRIMRDVGADARHGLVTFGDGPVEIRETRRRGGLAVGVASDEVRRFGGNPTKRARLIRAGADLIVPDFSQLPLLLPLLGIARSQ
jgi:phosphoglycolate phosphatase-like HAD superfamily hydrolase